MPTRDEALGACRLDAPSRHAPPITPLSCFDRCEAEEEMLPQSTITVRLSHWRKPRLFPETVALLVVDLPDWN